MINNDSSDYSNKLIGELENFELLKDSPEQVRRKLVENAIHSETGLGKFTEIGSKKVALSLKNKAIYVKEIDGPVSGGQFKVTQIIEKHTIDSPKPERIAYKKNSNNREKYIDQNRMPKDTKFKPFRENILPQLLIGLEKEIQIQSKLEHPNIVKIYEFHKMDENKISIFEEQLVPLDIYLSEQKENLDLSIKLKWVKQLASALYYLHSLGYTHEDIKIDNVFIDSNGNLKLGDFGQAGLIGEKTILRNKTIQPPESRERKATNHSTATDVYQFGLFLDNIFAPKSEKIDSRYDDSYDSSETSSTNSIYEYKSEINSNSFLANNKELSNLQQRCIKHNPVDRPCMKEILITLDRIKLCSDD